jgi:hypothetical protein
LTGDMKGAFDRGKKAFQLFMLILKTSKSVDLPTIQQKYGFNKQRKIKLMIHDSKRSFTVSLINGELKYYKVFQGEPDNIVEVDRLYTLKYIVNGERPGLSPRNLLKYYPYALTNAWANGEICADGKASTNMVFCIIDIVTECIKAIPVDELNAILPDDNDDYLQEVLGVARQTRKSFTVKV